MTIKRGNIWGHQNTVSVLAIWSVLLSAPAFATSAPQDEGAPPTSAAEGPKTDTTANPRIVALLVILEDRIDGQDARIAELEKIVDRQAYTIERQSAEMRAQRAQTTRLRLALAERGEWETIDRNAQGAGEYQTARLDLPSRAAAKDLPPRNDPQAVAAATRSQNGAQARTGDRTLAEGERPQSDKAVDQLLLDQGGVLLPAGKLQIEPSIDYTSISSDRVNISGFSIFNAIVIGTIRVDDVNRDIVSSAITARYGTGHRMQVDLRVPYTYRNDTETTGIGTADALERNISGHGLGDIGLTLAWQPVSAKGGRPATIFKVQAEYPTGKSAFEIERVPAAEDSPEQVLVEAPTGSGFYTISPGVTFVWPIDPVVLFAGGGYNYTFPKSYPGFGYIEPGHGFEFFAGMNMSINERVSMNFSFLDKQRFATKSNGVRLPGSGTHDARLSLGAAIGLSDNVSLVLSAASGLTDESPDFTFGARLPISF